MNIPKIFYIEIGFKMELKVIRKNKPDCIVSIMLDRNTNKYAFVNLTSKHICFCRFNSIREALLDLNNRNDVLTYIKI